MKVKIEVEVPDNFEPYTIGCADHCPFRYWDDFNCVYDCRYTEISCPLLKAMEGESSVNA